MASPVLPKTHQCLDAMELREIQCFLLLAITDSKVQNQRQKAKRPKAGGEAAPAPPAQFAPYPNPATHAYSAQTGSGQPPPTNPSQLPSHGSIDISPRPSLSGTTNIYSSGDRSRGAFSNEYSTASPSGLVSQLTGPGVPGRTMLIDPYEKPYSETMSSHGPTFTRGVPRAADFSPSSHSLPSTRQPPYYDYPRASSPRSFVGSPVSPVSHNTQTFRTTAQFGQFSVSVGRHSQSHSSLRTLQPAIHDQSQRHTSASVTSGMVTAEPGEHDLPLQHFNLRIGIDAFSGPSYSPAYIEARPGTHTHSSSRTTRFDPVRGSSARVTSPRPPSRLSS